MPRIINLSTLTAEQGFVIQGGAGDYTGYSVSDAGDVNNDGFGDVIVGEFRGDDGGPDAGEAYVLFGGAGGFGSASGDRQVVDLTTLSGVQGFIIQGDDAFDFAGLSVSAAGDVNGDGFDDMVVGAPDGDDGGYNAGEAYVVFGGADGFGEAMGARQVVDLTTLSGAQGFIIQGDGDVWRSRAGFSVSVAGDVNNDGFDDVIIGAYVASEAYVVFGSAGGFGTAVGARQVIDLSSLSGARGFVIQGLSDFTAYSVSEAGDINNDSFDDVIINVFTRNEAFVLFGDADGFGTTVGGRQVVDLLSLHAAEGFLILGNTPDDWAWSSVSAAGDVNGDGFDDVIVGVPRGGDGGVWSGQAYVLFGCTGSFGTLVNGRQVIETATLSAAQGFVIQGDKAGDTAGYSVSTAGDVNGDGFDDLIIGARYGDAGGRDSGQAYVLFGSNAGFGSPVGSRQVVDLTTLSSAEGFLIQGDMPGDGVGVAVSTAGDIDGDGFDDLIVGARGGDGAGEAYVVFGGNFTHAVAATGTEEPDRINSDANGQTIFGAQSDDTLFGNGGDDSLNGGSGDDSLGGGADDDTLAGGSGDDSAIGAGGDDRALGGDGDDTLSGRVGDDTLHGEASNDSLVGNAGNDSLDGGQGNDILTGGAGDDTLAGGGRGDMLIGGEGADMLTGGTGGDRFVFAAGSSSVGNADTVTDFRGGIDTLVIRTGQTTGSFLGEGAFTGAGGIEVRWAAGLGKLQVDLDGDGTLDASDLVIAGATLATLTADDLLFV